MVEVIILENGKEIQRQKAEQIIYVAIQCENEESKDAIGMVGAALESKIICALVNLVGAVIDEFPYSEMAFMYFMNRAMEKFANNSLFGKSEHE